MCASLVVTAYDPEGNKRGIGIDSTLAGAAAAAWVLSHDDVANQFGRVPLSLHDFDRVPRHVPNGWTFEIENMPKQESA